jgi:CubicO group peptidase (beta-lactamase class C family)
MKKLLLIVIPMILFLNGAAQRIILFSTGKVSKTDREKLAGIPGQMQKFVDASKVAGIVTLFIHEGQVASFDAVGFRDKEKGIPVQKNTIFRIASMTKPFAAAAIMMLVEEGKVKLDDPVEKYLPEYKNMWLASESTVERMTLVRPKNKMTVREVLAHTDGLSSLSTDLSVNSIRENSLAASQRPLQFEPGSNWRYGNEGINTAARIVEVLSGQDYSDFLLVRIFRPLKMEETFFQPVPKFMDRIAVLYQPDASSSALEVKTPPDYLFRYPNPAGALYSTAMDMAIWMQTMLNKGIYNGTRILSEESVMEMTKVQTGNLNTGFTEGMGFGLGFGIVRHPAGVTSMLSPGTFGHGGAFGTQYWADPQTRAIYILMIQRQGFGNGDASDIRETFQQIAAGSIMK